MNPQVGDIWESPWHPPHLLLQLNNNILDEWYFWALQLDNGQEHLLIFRVGEGGAWRRVS